MSCMKIRVNWHQGQHSEDKMVRVHKAVDDQPDGCQFDEMVDSDDYDCLDDAEAAMKKKSLKKYKQCEHCWDGEEVDL